MCCGLVEFSSIGCFSMLQHRKDKFLGLDHYIDEIQCDHNCLLILTGESIKLFLVYICTLSGKIK